MYSVRSSESFIGREVGCHMPRGWKLLHVLRMFEKQNRRIPPRHRLKKTKRYERQKNATGYVHFIFSTNMPSCEAHDIAYREVWSSKPATPKLNLFCAGYATSALKPGKASGLNGIWTMRQWPTRGEQLVVDKDDVPPAKNHSDAMLLVNKLWHGRRRDKHRADSLGVNQPPGTYHSTTE